MECNQIKDALFAACNGAKNRMYFECPAGVACFASPEYCKAYGRYIGLLGLIEDLGLLSEFYQWKRDHARTVCVR